MCIRISVVVPVLAFAAIALVACSRQDAGNPLPAAEQAAESPAAAATRQLTVEQSAIRAADGSVLLELAEVPGSIRVTADSEFGAAERFDEATLSPDDVWLAFTTSGAAHSAGWLTRTGTGDPQPAAFQYGGSVSIGPWSADSRFVAFIHEGPAGERTLSVVDSQRLGDTVEAGAIPVRTPDHDDLPPEARRYEVVGWQGGDLVFELGGKRWVFDPAAGTVVEDV